MGTAPLECKSAAEKGVDQLDVETVATFAGFV